MILEEKVEAADEVEITDADNTSVRGVTLS